MPHAPRLDPDVNGCGRGAVSDVKFFTASELTAGVLTYDHGLCRNFIQVVVFNDSDKYL